ncbi:UvrD-helicase domain-containing protein [uncultured Slackia sp.]|uniref:UvrD-helicase domain-containing protein n=1 Tax=uncultured Slackia sp. TaxID=665903 RepID=UPI0025D3DED7|nr:UvrD-helicase domain-containing protein [uncultured Slackia sp.]
MDFSTFKPGQLACVTTLDAPVAVSAGAGSGKTFTLTQRIAWALMEGSAQNDDSFLNGIDEVLAITFTEKAAGEIKARVKSVLRAEGMASEALKVDAAWISTIHGMCSRILHSHAVQLGLDPSFGVLDEAQANRLMDEAIEEALAGANEFVEPCGTDALFAEFRARSGEAFNSSSVEDMVRTLVRCAVASPRGFSCFAAQPPARSAGMLLRGLTETMRELHDLTVAQKPGKTRDAWLQKAEAFLEDADAAFESGEVGTKALIDLFEACPFPSAGFGGKEFKERAKEAQGACVALATEAKHLIALPLLDELMALSHRAFDGYCRRKRDAGMMDNDDLLIETARALERDDIAQEFADKFKLVMVDEFQDTDQLQVDMITKLSGPGACRLCTVGDAQQSIYRFRGADVAVYKRRLDAVRNANPSGMITLPDNFRSHGDVLKFVDRIFGQPQVFGDEFMSLAASRKEPVKNPYQGGRRIDVLLTTHPSRGGVNSALARRIEAARIARRLSELRQAGHRAGDMAVLLGRMTNADVYADALRAEGFACVIAGGSVFASAPETGIMLRLAQVIANPRATAALFELLASDMFALSADDFIELSTKLDEKRGVPRRRGLYEGFVALEDAVDADACVSAPLAHAVSVVRGLASKAGRVPMARIMEDAVRASGWLARLDSQGAEGLSIAGNVMKAIRLVGDIESDNAFGPAETVRAFEAHLALSKEAPGALSAKGGDFVSIMTVHASKGLEFPIVAVAEMERGKKGGGGGLSCEVVEGKAYASLLPDKSVADRGGLWVNKKAPEGYGVLPEYIDGASPADVEHASDPLTRACAMRAYAEQQEAQERRRLLYVALTRAKEALVFAMTTTGRASGFTSGADHGVYDDVRSALCGVEDFASGDTMVDFGGSTLALVSRLDAAEEDVVSFLGEDALLELSSQASATEDDGGEASGAAHPDGKPAVPFAIPNLDAEADDSFEERPWRSSRLDVTSYSALAQGDDRSDGGDAVSGDAACEGDEDDAFWDALCASLSADADKATDVGTAFHLLAQRMVESREGNRLVVPDGQAIDRVAMRHGLGSCAKGRLEKALRRWAASDIATDVAQRAFMCAEVPFFVEVGASLGGASFYLEGSIDLFAYDAQGSGRACIVDYKTGGSPDESDSLLETKHELQAVCYAYATLLQGYGSVDATFVRVEQERRDASGQPQCVRYHFDASDLLMLEKRIVDAYAQSGGK